MQTDKRVSQILLLPSGITEEAKDAKQMIQPGANSSSTGTELIANMLYSFTYKPTEYQEQLEKQAGKKSYQPSSAKINAFQVAVQKMKGLCAFNKVKTCHKQSTTPICIEKELVGQWIMKVGKQDNLQIVAHVKVAKIC